MFTLKPFQESAISQLKEKFLTLWKLGDHNVNLTFKSPTGSGKTVMVAQFLRDIIADPRFSSANVGFIWITNSDTLAMQSKDKLFSYYGGASENPLVDMNNLRDGSIPKNGVFFINWQKLVSKAKDNRKLRTEGEANTTFDQYLENTHLLKREVVLIIDEEHIASDTVLASDLIKNVIKPRIIIGVSATPQNKGIMVEVDHKNVIQEGLIKEKIVFQTKEDLEKSKGMNDSEALLTLAFDKRKELVSYYKKLKIDINPLVLIQLPNDDRVSKETENTTKQDFIVSFLKSQGVLDDEIAIWLSDDKINLKDLEKHNSPVSFLLFKQAIATGWDCPRASILVMFREIKNPTFAIQTVGRILRMPLGTHFSIPELNLGYLYTNYKRNEVLVGYAKSTDQNRPAINGSYRKQSVKPIVLDSVFMSRTDYNDLGDSFQETFKKVANDYFGIINKDTRANITKKLTTKNLVLNKKVTNGLIVDVEIDDYDNFKQELLSEGSSYEQEMSQYDLEKLYNLFCFNIITKQIDEDKKFAPERSWGKLKTALNVWLLGLLKEERQQIYHIIVNDFIKANGVLGNVIGKALSEYRPIREQEVNRKSERSKRTEQIEIPRPSLFYTDQYEEMKVKRSAMQPFYIEKEYTGKKNETNFIKVLEENENVVWWYKNGDSGSEFFSIPYHDLTKNKESLFYPDWIIKTSKGLYIIDTKGGDTAKGAKERAESLQAWLKGKKGYYGGIAVQDGSNGWKINAGSKYEYTTALKGWQDLEDFLK
jgi:type III restriction enzyme